MDKFSLDGILSIVNDELKKRKMENYGPLYPMLRRDSDKLYIGVLLTDWNDDIWNKDNNIKPSAYVLLDVNNFNILEINKTEDKDFVKGDIKPNKVLDNQKELSEYSVRKSMEYKKYFMNDIKNDLLPIQKKLGNILNNEIEVDGDMVNINDYLIANMEPKITEKIDELVDLLVTSKYNSINFYYENLIKNIIKEYNEKNTINIDKMKICIEIMNNYYYGVVGIDNFFNV